MGIKILLREQNGNIVFTLSVLRLFGEALRVEGLSSFDRYYVSPSSCLCMSEEAELGLQ